MQQHPLDYERPTPERKSVARRVFGRIVIGTWVLVAAALVFLVSNSSDLSPLQWPAAFFFMFSMMGALAVTVFHWDVLVPVLSYRNHKSSTSV